LIVSHDRDFLDRTVTITLGLDGSGTVDVVAGGYEDWERRRKASAPTKRGAIAKNAVAAAPATRARAKLSYKDQRDYDLLPKRIETLDAVIARDQVLLEDPDLYSRDPDRFDRLMAAIGQAQADKTAAELRWLDLAEQVEALG
ncbi:MAG: ABC transporter ATP-binding protein, partial [Pseudomonadota bacterium]|nr:ABC transporter ATP-binding protein [Pseudomonadota bacterium]